MLDFKAAASQSLPRLAIAQQSRDLKQFKLTGIQ
jgi:hypothetical protein